MDVFDYIRADGGGDAGEYDEEEQAYGYDGDTGWFGSSIVKSVGKAAKGAFKVAKKGVNTVTSPVRHIAKAVTGNPLWNIAQTGVSFIPGVGQGVSAGMAAASKIGRGASLADIGLAAARGAIPGGPAAQAAFDIAHGALRGHGLSASAMRALRAQVPGGAAGRGAFDAAVALQSGSLDARKALRAGLSVAERAAFDAAVNARPRALTSFRSLRPIGSRATLIRMPVRVRPPNMMRPFPALGMPANRAASMIMRSPELRGLTPARIARQSNLSTGDVRNAFAELIRRHGGDIRGHHDVGEFDTIDGAASRCNCTLPPDLAEWPGTDDTAAIEAVRLPPIGITRSLLQSLFDRGDVNIKRALLAHELLSTVARNTGELQGTRWTVRAGDSPFKVAQIVVHDGNRWREIAGANPGMKVTTTSAGPGLSGFFVGKTLELPPSWFPSAVPAVAVTESSPSGPPFPPPSEFPTGFPSSVYVIRAGDTGEKVALRITGNKDRWRELLVTNPKLKDEKFGIALFAGKPLTLPASWVKPQALPEIVIQGSPELESAPVPIPVLLPAPPLPAPTPTSPGPPPVPPFVGGGDVLTSPGLPPLVTSVPTPPATTPEPEPTGPIVTGSPEQIATVQIMLASFFRSHPTATFASEGAPFGATGDLTGEWTERTTEALAAFQKFWNASGRDPRLPTDGIPDGVTIAALLKITGEDGNVQVKESIQLAVDGVPQTPATTPAPSSAPKKSSSGGALLAILAPLVLSAL